jgi:hypothetical protein
MTQAQGEAIGGLCAMLGTPVPDLTRLTRRQAGDLIMALRARGRGEQR